MEHCIEAEQKSRAHISGCLCVLSLNLSEMCCLILTYAKKSLKPATMEVFNMLPFQCNVSPFSNSPELLPPSSNDEFHSSAFTLASSPGFFLFVFKSGHPSLTSTGVRGKHISWLVFFLGRHRKHFCQFVWLLVKKMIWNENDFVTFSFGPIQFAVARALGISCHESSGHFIHYAEIFRVLTTQNIYKSSRTTRSPCCC